tara:strand:+ start:30 stop:416 length:387 start_codon:yes stop_codon:yes gene_type:complete
MLLPAITIGCFSAAVLNLNNMRDWKNDKACNKNTLVVKIGLSNAKIYHFIILITGMFSSIIYILIQEFKLIELIFIVTFIPIFIHLKTINKIKNTPAEFNPELKKMVISTFLFSTLFFISIIIKLNSF